MEHNFCVMYIWQEMMDIQYAEIDDALVLCTCSNKFKPFFIQPNHLSEDAPVLPLFSKLKSMAEEAGYPFSLRGITPEYAQKLISEGFDGTFLEDENYFEYVYNQEDLATLKGKKFTQKRNHINKLLSEHAFEYLPYEETMRTDVLNIIEQWGEQNGRDDDFYFEKRAVERSLDHRQELNISGGVILLDGRLSAFTLGVPGDEEMFCVLFEKAQNTNGLYQLINREFSKTLGAYQYINRQEDLGIEGLRKAKRSYNPAFMVEKKYIQGSF